MERSDNQQYRHQIGHEVRSPPEYKGESDRQYTDLSAQQARRELYEIIRSDAPFEHKAHDALELGRQYLDADNAHLTRIDEETNHWEAPVSTDPMDGQFPPGMELDLETTYCRRTIAAEEPIALHDAPNQGWADDPAFEEHGLHCYHGTTIVLDDEPYGTVCFVAEDPRTEPYSDGETMFAELITQQLERELERERHEAELTRQTNLVNVLNRVLRHNLRNDMSVIRGRTEVMADQLQEDTHFDITLSKIDHLLNLCEKARELENIVGQTLDRQPTDIREVVEEGVRAVERDHPSASFAVEGDSDVSVALLPSFERAVRELVENAAKHGGDAPTVTVTVETVPNAVAVHIADDGPGLSDQEQTALDTGEETPLVHGSGLGLWLVHWIVTSHDGTVDATVTDDGTTITMTVPRSAETTTQQVQQLREARDLYQASFDEARDAMFIVDDETQIVDANAETDKIFGTETEPLLGRSVQEFLPDDFDFETAWNEFIASGEQRDTVTIVDAEGGECPVEYAARADVVPGQHLVVARDITARVEREKQLKQAETVFQHTQDAIFLIDVTDEQAFHIERVNAVYEELTGLSDEEIRGKTPREVVGDDIGREIERQYQTCVQQRETIEYPEEIPIDGEMRYWQTKLTPIVDDGSVEKLVGAMRNVTDQRTRQQELRKHRERFERLLDTSPVGITILDRNGTIVRANDRAEEVLNLSKSEITGRQYDAPEWDIVDADGKPIPSEELPFRRVRETGEPIYEYEHGIKTGDDGLRWLSINAAPLTDSDGTVERVIAALTDITEQNSMV